MRNIVLGDGFFGPQCIYLIFTHNEEFASRKQENDDSLEIILILCVIRNKNKKSKVIHSIKNSNKK